MEGFLRRKVSFLKGYQEKWFVLTDDGILKQFEEQPLDEKQVPKWKIIVALADIETKSDGIRFNLVVCNGSSVKLKGRNIEETTKWVDNLKKASRYDIFSKVYPLKLRHRTSTDDDNGSDAESTENEKEDNKGEEPVALDKEEIHEEMKEMSLKPKKAPFTQTPMVAAIDIGSAYSGSAYSLRSDFLRNPLKVITMVGFPKSGLCESSKIPTVLLLDPQKKFMAFGNDAENMYADLVENKPEYAKQCYCFTRFKMQLYNNENLKRSMKIHDISGQKETKAIDVFAASIEFMKMKTIQGVQEQISSLQEGDIHWVITVPAIWDEAARQFMIEAAEKADINRDKLTLALEPEAAALYCKYLEVKNIEQKLLAEHRSFQTGARFLVVDLGGGTVDITANEVLETGQLREICSPSGGPWGGNMVNANMLRFLRRIFGSEPIKKFMNECPVDYLSLVKDIEMKKRLVSSGQNFYQPLPYSLRKLVEEVNPEMISDQYQGQAKIVQHKLKINTDVVSSIVDENVDKVAGYIERVLKERETKGISSILLVDEYASCDTLQESIQTKFSNLKVICPFLPDVAVLTGAVITGHMETPIVGRLAKHHYGIGFVS